MLANVAASFPCPSSSWSRKGFPQFKQQSACGETRKKKEMQTVRVDHSTKAIFAQITATNKYSLAMQLSAGAMGDREIR
jgi:hypothetical protein